MQLSSNIDVMSLFTPLDAFVFAAILVATLAAVIWGNRLREKAGGAHSFIEHMLMGRSLTLPMFTATMVATWYGGIFGVTEIAFKHGIFNFITQGFFWYVTYIIFALFLVDRIARFDAITLPELVGQMFGPKSACLAGIFNFFNVVPIAYCISLGLLFQVMFGWSLWIGMAAGISFVSLYSMWGGFRAVVFSDLVQFFVMCLAVFFVIVFAAFSFGGLDYLQARLPASHFSPLGESSWATTLVWGLIALSTLVDPNFYQRCFAAKSPSTAKKGLILSTVIWFLFDICTTLGGMYARAAIPDADPTQGYMIFALQVLPPGFRGFFLAGVLATILSTIDSYVFIASNTVTYDLGPKRWRRSLNLHRLSVILVGALAFGMGIAFDGSVKSVWKTLGSYSAGCMLLPVMVGYIKPGLIDDRSFIAGSLFGVAAITYWRFAEHQGFWQNVDGLYVGVAATLTGMVMANVAQWWVITCRKRTTAD